MCKSRNFYWLVALRFTPQQWSLKWWTLAGASAENFENNFDSLFFILIYKWDKRQNILYDVWKCLDYLRIWRYYSTYAFYPGRQTYAYYSQNYCPLYGDTNMVILSEAIVKGPIPIFRVEIRNFRVKIILVQLKIGRSCSSLWNERLGPSFSFWTFMADSDFQFSYSRIFHLLRHVCSRFKNSIFFTVMFFVIRGNCFGWRIILLRFPNCIKFCFNILTNNLIDFILHKNRIFFFIKFKGYFKISVSLKINSFTDICYDSILDYFMKFISVLF